MHLDESHNGHGNGHTSADESNRHHGGAGNGGGMEDYDIADDDESRWMDQ